MTTTSISAPLGERTHIDIRAIERELNDLWKQLAENADGAQQAVTRTCVLNLIVVTGGGRAAAHATEIVARLTERHPNRAFVISATPNAHEDVLDAWVQTHCQMPSPGRPQVCGEQVTIEARGAAVDRVAGTLLPLLVPDVPVILWWPRGEPAGDSGFRRFAEFVDRVIVDSATFAAPEAGLARMAALLNPDPSTSSGGAERREDHDGRPSGAGTTISDLSWSRLTPWRELVAQFFDAPALVPHLAEITHVAMDYEAHAGTAADRSQALLLLGWLAARLGWRTAGSPSEQPSGTTLHLASASGAPITVELRPAAPADDALERLAALAIECQRARFTITRDDTPNCAVARSEIEGMQPIQRKVRLEYLDEAELIGEELRLLGHDQTFEAVLKVTARLIAQAVG